MKSEGEERREARKDRGDFARIRLRRDEVSWREEVELSGTANCAEINGY